MKRLIPLAAAVLIRACSANAPAEGLSSDLVRFGLNRPVKSLSVSMPEREFDYTVRFNGDGRIASVDEFAEDGSLAGTEEYVYDDEGRLVHMYHTDNDGQIDSSMSCEYDGQFISRQEYKGMNNDIQHCFENDNDGEHIITTRYYLENELRFVSHKAYDGLDMTETVCDTTGAVLETAYVEFFAADKPSRIRNNEDCMSVEYDEESGLPVASENCVLDSRGALQWEESLASEPQRTYEYEFDRRGNWIRRTEYAGQSPKLVITRKIRY